MAILQEQDSKTQVKRWYPRQVIFTADALKHKFAQKIREHIQELGIRIIETKNNRIGGIKGKTDAETYRNAKSTLAIVKAPEGQFRLQPIPPSADYQFHLAQGCPAHCQYCYLAGSLSGPPVVRAYGNLPDILENTRKYETAGKVTSFEASCYTDPLALEHLTGSLSETVRHFGERPDAHLRWVTKFDDIEPLLHLQHNGRTRCRMSVNASDIVRCFETGAAPLKQRMEALSSLIAHSYPAGLIVAPIIPINDWQAQYLQLFQELKSHIHTPCDLTFEFITHRFTPGSKEILQEWYPATRLEMNEDARSAKYNKFGGVKYVYKSDLMKEMKAYFNELVRMYFPYAEILYWT